MAQSVQKAFARDLSILENISDFVHRFVRANNIEKSHEWTLNFVIEELFTNFVKYNTGTSEAIVISLAREDDDVEIRIIDSGVEPFDPTQQREPDTGKKLKDREIGGLGIFLARKMVDHIDYHYENRQSTITVIKKLSAEHA